MNTNAWIQDGYPKQSRWLKVILLLLLFVVMDVIIQTGAATYAMTGLGITNSNELLIALNAYPLYFLVPTVLWAGMFIVILNRAGLPLFSGWQWNRKSIQRWLIGVILLIIAQIGMANLTAWLYPNQLSSVNEQILESALPQMPLWKTVLVFSIYAPIREEVITRGLIMRYLFPKYPYIGMVISAVVFASLHVTTLWIHFLTYFLMGLIFSWVYYQTGRIEYSIGLHMFNNLVSTVPMYL
ncbi:MAG: type II CAAX endopeptidase family protein [Aerococcus sp.]|nr:type II CAAX endopeptidase family protein [Aerococcus sp.]